MPYKSKTFEELLAKYVPIREPDHCWLWTGTITSTGYGLCYWQKKSRGAHRMVYENLVGPVAQGFELDHTCRTPRCVNPAHLEPVTHKENMRRGRHYWREQTHCARGHKYTPENTRIRSDRGSHRVCRACRMLERKHRYANGPHNRDKTHCPQGHTYDFANTYISSRGGRNCRECNKLQKQRATLAKKKLSA